MQIGTVPITGVDIPPPAGKPGEWRIMLVARDESAAKEAVFRITSFGPMSNAGKELTTFTTNFLAHTDEDPPLPSARPPGVGKVKFEEGLTTTGKKFWVATLQIDAKGTNEAATARTNVVFDVEIFPSEIGAKQTAHTVIARALKLGF